jgi:hypothetical protein
MTVVGGTPEPRRVVDGTGMERSNVRLAGGTKESPEKRVFQQLRARAPGGFRDVAAEDRARAGGHAVSLAAVRIERRTNSGLAVTRVSGHG